MVARVVKRGRPPVFAMVAAAAALAFWGLAREHDVPFASPAQIAAAPPDQRRAADSVLANAYRVQRGEVPPHRLAHCRKVNAAAESSLPSGDAFVTNHGTGTLVLSARRFAPAGWANDVAFVRSRATVRAHIPKDDVSLSWHVGLRPASGTGVDATLCLS